MGCRSTCIFAASAIQASAQMKGLGAIGLAQTVRNRALDFRVSKDSFGAPPLPLSVDMLVHKDIGANAAMGVGLANMYQRKRGPNFRPDDPLVRSRKPAVSVVVKF